MISVTSLSDLEAGKTYGLNAGLSCYVNAMGGVEFGAPLLKSAVAIVDANGNASIKITLGTSSVTIYGVTANTYVSAEGFIGYYDGSGWQSASYTTDGAGHVSSITFPISSIKNSYKLALVIGSDVMSSQFGGTDSNYNAILSVNWSKVVVGGDGTSTVSNTGTVAGTAAQTGDDTSMPPLAAMAVSLLVMAAIWNWRKRYTK